MQEPDQRTRPRWYALAEDLPALAAAGRRRIAAEGTTLLAPFDSFLWHRERTHRLFGFRYTIEVYTPGHKRTHGYYTLPIFHDGQLIGRIDPKIHRAERRLEIKGVHFEPWFARGAEPPPRPGAGSTATPPSRAWPIRSAPSPPSSAPTRRRSPSAPSRPRRSERR